jgi:hypothetical protein
MAALPLGRIYDLDLGANALDDKSLVTLARGMGGLGALHVDNNEIGAPGFVELGKQVTSLEFLQVGAAVKFGAPERAALLDGIAEAIATTPGFRSLRYLHFFRTGEPSAARVKQLRDRLPQLKRLSKSSYTEWDGRDPKRWEEHSDDDL